MKETLLMAHRTDLDGSVEAEPLVVRVSGGSARLVFEGAEFELLREELVEALTLDAETARRAA